MTSNTLKASTDQAAASLLEPARSLGNGACDLGRRCRLCREDSKIPVLTINGAYPFTLKFKERS